MPIPRRFGSGRQRVTYLLNDEFLTTQAAPLPVNRDCEPGPGKLTFIQVDGDYGIDSAGLRYPEQASSAWGDNGYYGEREEGGAFIRAGGLAFVSALRADNLHINAPHVFSWHKTTALGTDSFMNSAAGFIFETGASYRAIEEGNGVALTDASWGAMLQEGIAIVTRPTTGAYFFKRTSGVWRLMWVGMLSTATSLYPAFKNYDSKGVQEFIRVVQLLPPFDTDMGIAVLNHPSPTPGNSYQAAASGIYHMQIAVPGLGGTTAIKAELRFRVQNASNYWTATVLDNGTFKLSRVAGGVSTDEYSVAGAIPASTTVLIVVSTHEAYVDTYKLVGSTWTKLGTAVERDYLTTYDRLEVTLGAGWLATYLRAWASELPIYANLNTVMQPLRIPQVIRIHNATELTAVTYGSEPGASYELESGVYTGEFTSIMKGKLGQPVTVRPVLGAAPIIDGGLNINQRYTVWKDMELRYTGWVSRVTAIPGSSPGDIPTSKQLAINASFTEFMGWVVHDVAQVGSSGAGSRVHDNVFYHNGWNGPDRGHGHNMYGQNDGVESIYKHNVLLSSGGWNYHVYTEGGFIDNISLIQNIAFFAGKLFAHAYLNYLYGGAISLAHNAKLDDNSSYIGDTNNIGYLGGVDGVILTNNYMPEGIDLSNATVVVNSGNTFTTPGSGTHIEIYESEYEPYRAIIAIYNWDNLTSVDVDVSSVLDAGMGYQLRNAQDYFGDIVTGFVPTGGVLTVNMQASAHTVAAPVATAAEPKTFPTFGCFILRRNA